MTIFDSELEKILEEDVGYGDLTTSALGICDHKATIKFSSRSDFLVASCVEEASRMCKMMNLDMMGQISSNAVLKKGDLLLQANGSASNIHKAHKSVQNLLDYSCGISTYTKKMVDLTKEINPDMIIATTRKTPPYLKKIAIKSIKAGGAIAHRLNLSESILIFKHHRAFFPDQHSLQNAILKIKRENIEKHLIMEADSYEEAMSFAKMGVDILQLDKFEFSALQKSVKALKENYPHIKIIATGGINLSNVQEYAQLKVDMIVTSSPYFAPPADIKVEIYR